MHANRVYLCTFMTFLCLLAARAQNEEELKAIAELEMAGLELQDECEFLASTYKSSLISNTFSEKINALEGYGRLMKVHSENMKPYEDNIPFYLQRNWTVLVKSGDNLLTDPDWSTLVAYEVGNDELMHTETVHCDNNSQNCLLVKKGYQHILENSRNQTLLQKGWFGWQLLLSLRRHQFPLVLNLVPKAASLNDFLDPRSYWEMFTDQEGAYAAAEDLWTQIKPLYFKLQNFVKTRLFRYYKITDDKSEIPVYLLGSNFGNDWSHIADIVLPHPLIYRRAEAYLDKMPIQDIYKAAEEITQQLSLGPLGNKFWTNSLFNMTFCENHVLSFCVQEHSELLACDKTSWVAYMDAFEVAIDVALRNSDYLNLPLSNLRYSVVDDAVAGLGSVLAIKNMRYKGVWDTSLFPQNGTDADPNKMTQLLLIALRVLPKLPYYLAADKWRLHLLENGFDNMNEEWWRFRKEFQGVEGISNNETDFLGDSFIASNKPYLSKFLGTIFQFHLLENYDWSDTNESFASSIGNDENFLSMIHERSATPWPDLIGTYYSVYELSATPLLEYFAPLEEYFNSAPLEQVVPTFPPTKRTTSKPKIEYEEVKLKSAEIRKNETVGVNFKVSDSETERPEHIHDYPVDGPNPVMQSYSMYIGLGLLGAVAVMVLVVIVKKVKKNRRTNNRRFET
jgi:hypothetical protein